MLKSTGRRVFLAQETRKASRRLTPKFAERAYSELFGTPLTQTGTRPRQNDRKFAVKPKKRTFDKYSSGLARPWSAYFAGISGFATLRPARKNRASKRRPRERKLC